MSKGVIYILTNPSFKEYVKIGYADDMATRLKQLNNSECTPFGFRVYATYEVDHRLTDLKLHSLIDKLNPNLRSIDNIEGKKRVREFYAMSPSDAYEILEAIAEINGTPERLTKWNLSEADKELEDVAEEIIKKSRRPNLDFLKMGIPVGAILVYTGDETIKATVVDARRVEYNGLQYSLTGLTRELLNLRYSVCPTWFWKYNGRIIDEIYGETFPRE